MTELNEKDVLKIITLIRLNFDNAYRCGAEELKLLIRQWYTSLRKYPREIVSEAVNRVLERAEFAPHLGNIMNEIVKIHRALGKSDSEIWNEIAGCLYEVSTCYHSLHYQDGEKYMKRLKEIYAGLPEEAREYCGSVWGLAKIADIPDDQIQYEKGRFLKEVKEIRERIEIKGAIAERLRIGEGNPPEGG